MTAALRDWGVFRIRVGDCIETMRSMPDASVQCVVTSPPYFRLRDYGHDGQIGLEPTPDDYVAKMVEVFREARRVLRDDGTLWLNLGDSYAGNGGVGGHQGDMAGRKHGSVLRTCRPRPGGLKTKDLIGIPWRVAFALQADGWYLRQDIIWHKPNPIPESVRDRCTKAHEYLFLMTKSERYFWDAASMQEPATNRGAGNKTHKYSDRVEAEEAAGNHLNRTKLGLATIAARETRNRRSVWSVGSQPFKGAHFATFPPALIEPCILAGSRKGDIVLDPFGGAGTTGLVSTQHGRVGVMCELNPEYADIAERRIARALFGSLAFGDAA